MATVDELLNTQLEDLSEDIITIDSKTRQVFVPESQRLFGVESDQDSERKYFRCKKVVGHGVDLSEQQVRINFQNANQEKDQYIVDDVVVDGDYVTFSWLLSRKVTEFRGEVKFIVCAINANTDGRKTVEWNTAIAYGEVIEGFEVDAPQPNENELDVIYQLINMVKDETAAAKEENITAIEEKGQQVLASIPNDYTELSSKVKHISEDAIVEIHSINLFNAEFNEGQYINVSGAVIANELMCYSKPMFVHAGDYLVMIHVPSFGENTNIFGVADDGVTFVPIAATLIENNIFKFTLESGMHLSFNCPKSLVNSFMLVKGTTYNEWPKIYQKYFDSYFTFGRNLEVYDKRSNDSLNFWSGEYIDGYYLTASAIRQLANHSYTKPQWFEAGAYLVYIANSFGSNESVYMTFDDGVTFAEIKCTAIDATLRVYAFTLEAGAYVSFNITNADMNSKFMVVNGETIDDWPTEYQKYYSTWEVVKEGVKFNDEMTKQVAELSVPNTLYGKVIAFEGDSICSGRGFTGGYGKIIAERNGMTYFNTAASGGTITYGITDTSTGVNLHWISDGVDKMNAAADYYIFEGGINDAALSGIEYGVITSGYSDALNRQTFLGAFEYCCKVLVTKYHGKKCGYIFVHGIFDNGHKWNVTWRNDMKKILNKWGVPYIDLQEEMPPLNAIDSLKATYTADGDGWHPNEAGYKRFYCDKIESWIRSL